MPTDRISYIGFRDSDSKLVVFKAGSLKYNAIEERSEFMLIDGEIAENPLWIHLEFSVLIGYLYQQVKGSDVPAAIQDAAGSTLPTLRTTDYPVDDILNDIREASTTAIRFYPVLLTPANSLNTSYVNVISNQKSFAFLEARKNGRFPMYIPINIRTKTPLTEYPSWFNR